MYHLDVGRVYAHPGIVSKEEALMLRLPSDNFDSIMVKLHETPEDIRVNTSLSKLSYSDDSLVTQNYNYSTHYVIFNRQRITPAYKLTFRLNPESEKF